MNLTKLKTHAQPLLTTVGTLLLAFDLVFPHSSSTATSCLQLKQHPLLQLSMLPIYVLVLHQMEKYADLQCHLQWAGYHLDSIKTHTMTSVPFHHTPNTMARPTSWVGGATPPAHNHQPRLPSSQTLPSVAPRFSTRCTRVRASEVTIGRGTPIRHVNRAYRKASPKPRPTALTYAPTAHGRQGTPTSQLRLSWLF